MGGATSPPSPCRYQAEEAIRFLQQNPPAGAFPEVHVLRNCCILRCVGAGPVGSGRLGSRPTRVLPRFAAICEKSGEEHPHLSLELHRFVGKHQVPTASSASGRGVFHCTFCILRHVDTTVCKYRQKLQWDGIDKHLSRGAQRGTGVAGVLWARHQGPLMVAPTGKRGRS